MQEKTSFWYKLQYLGTPRSRQSWDSWLTGGTLEKLKEISQMSISVKMWVMTKKTKQDYCNFQLFTHTGWLMRAVKKKSQQITPTSG